MNLCFFHIKNIHFEGGPVECRKELEFCIRLIFTFAGVVVSNVLHCVPHNLLIINMSLACDLSAHHDHSSLCHCLAGNLCVRILLEMGVQDCVRHLVAHLVRVALPHRLGSEKELSSVLCLHHGLLHVAHVGSHPGLCESRRRGWARCVRLECCVEVILHHKVILVLIRYYQRKQYQLRNYKR